MLGLLVRSLAPWGCGSHPRAGFQAADGEQSSPQTEWEGLEVKLLFQSDPQGLKHFPQKAEGKARGTKVPMTRTSPAGSWQRMAEGGRLLTGQGNRVLFRLQARQQACQGGTLGDELSLHTAAKASEDLKSGVKPIPQSPLRRAAVGPEATCGHAVPLTRPICAQLSFSF